MGQQFPLEFIPANNCGYSGYDISAGTTDETVGMFYIPFKCLIKRAELTVTKAIVGTPVFHFDKETAGTESTSASTGDVALLTMVSGTAAGKVVFDDYSSANAVTANPGQWIVVTLDTTGTSGIVQPGLIVEEIPEIHENISAFLETA